VSPFHLDVKNVLTEFLKKTNSMHNTVSKILQSKNTLAIDVYSWLRGQVRREAILVIAYGVLILLSSDTKQVLYEPFNLKSVLHLLIAENTPSTAAFQLDEEVEAKFGTSHLIIQTKSLGLLMRFILDHYFSLKLDFTDTIALNINGCLEDFAFDQLRSLPDSKSGVIYSSNRFILPGSARTRSH